uniref:Uncharacterized protein n=1 Tax=Cucumis melo TaxID=3656 RepID=A0A9I9ELX8_CUCME
MGFPRDHHLFMIVWSDGITTLMRCYVYEWSDGVTYSPIILSVHLGSLKTSKGRDRGRGKLTNDNK